jgi:signal transduction histidine kinase/CheY-like chemotaxis protein
MSSAPHDELRVLVGAAFARDAELAAESLTSAGMSAVVCATDDAFFDALAFGAGAAVVAEERLDASMLARLRPYLDSQPAWSDLPLVVLTAKMDGFEALLERLTPLGNVTALERPVRRAALVGAVRVALRARQRQYEARALLARLADTDRRKDAFIAMLGHELRNPLAAINGAAMLLDAVPDKGERLRRISDVLGRQVGHLQRLLDDLLDVARLTAGKIVLKRQRVDARQSARQVVTMLDHLARERGHRVTLEVADHELVVDADPVRLEQMIANLLHNAIKYTPDGGAIHVAVEQEDAHVRVRVVDNGRGLEPDSLERIFEHFTQVESTLDRAMGGLGLGLPLVRGLANMHGGTVDARSAGLGKGSEFTITLPLADGAEVAAAEGERASTRGLVARGLRVLLVDDFYDILDLLRLGLEERGCLVDTASDGRAAVERARTGTYDVAFVDIGLPGMDGLDVARTIRADAAIARLPLVAMSGYGGAEDQRRSAAAGFDRHLVKPVDADKLLSAARELIATRE